MLTYCLCFSTVQAEAKEKEKLKEENRRSKKLESGFRSLLRAKEVDHSSTWEDSLPKLEGDPAFESITIESERIRIFKVDYTITCVKIDKQV